MNLKTVLESYGLLIRDAEVDPYSYSPSEYNPPAKSTVKAHKELLKSIEAEENNRLGLLEGKTAQLISQTGVIFSLLSLFVPVFIDKVSEMPLLMRISFLTILALAFFFYILTIHNATKNFDIKRFTYSRPSPVNVIKYQNLSEDDFTVIEVKDLLYGANQNLKTNDVSSPVR